ncbi:MarR family winged helix-turn-helix transcriptional regulator [Pseudonocardia sp. GCM10023141]|uniref:MarR family winged helix-turn-helix transcriptional regulator n=1 Tax=Pseudonocardia sp. GCM10023141 TaxID=3252653 RepID=UPI00360CD741
MRSNDEIRGDLSFLLDKASQSLAARMTAALSDVGVTPRGYCVLMKAMPGELTQGEIAEIALLDKTTMVVTVDHLEGAGLARRTPAPTDRRARIVETTDEGAQVVARGRTIIDGVFDDVLGVLTEPERAAFLDAMVKLVGAGGPLSGAAQGEQVPRRKSSRTV